MPINLKMLLEVDTKTANKSVDKTTAKTKDLGTEVKNTDKQFDKMNKTATEGGEKSSKSLGKMKDRLLKVTTVIAAAAAGAVGLAQAMAAVAAVSETERGLLNLGVDAAALESMSHALDGTISKIQLMKAARAAINLGADPAALQQMAQAAAFMAKEFDQSRQSMLDLISNGAVSDAMLLKLGTSAQEIENQITAAGNRRLGELSETEKLLKRQELILAAVEKKSKGWTANTKKLGDEYNVVLTKLKDASTELGQEIQPVTKDILKLVLRWVKGTQMLVQDFKDITSWADKMGTTLGGSVANSWDKIIAKAHSVRAFLSKTTGIGDAAKAEADAVMRLQSVTARAAAIINAKQIKAAKRKAKIEKVLAAQQAAEMVKQQAPALARIKKLAAASKAAAAERKRQLLEDTKALQDQAKDLIRNFSEKIIQTVADAGGSFGGIASAMTDAFEKARVFSSTGFGLQGLNAAVKVAAQFQGDMKVDLIKQLELQKESLGIRGKALQSAKLIAGWIRGGADDTAEFLANEKAANAQLKIGLSTSAASAKVGAVQLEQLNLYKDVTKFLAGAETARNALLTARNDLQEKGTKKAQAQAKLHTIIISRLGLTVKRFKQISAQRKLILASAMALAKLDAIREKLAEAASKKAELRALKIEQRGAARGLLKAKGGISAGADIAAAAAQDKEALAIRIRALKAQLEDAFQRFLIADTGSDEAKRQSSQMQHLNSMINATKTLAETKEAMYKQEAAALTLTGQLQNQFASTAAARTSELAAEMKSSFSSMISGAGTAIANVTESIVKGDEDVGANFGKGALEALGNLAMQWGLFFMAQGGAMIASGLIPNGAGVMVGGGLLLALGGGLKGGASLLGPQAATSPSGGTSRGTSFNDRIPGTQPEEAKNIRETYVLINGTPWNKNSDAQEFTEFMGWAKAGGRKTGKQLMVREA